MPTIPMGKSHHESPDQRICIDRALLFSNATFAEDSVSEADRAAIERLHQQDKEATLSDSADQLAKLWDDDAVRFVAGRPAEIGAATIYADDKQWEMSAGREHTLLRQRDSGCPDHGRLGIRMGIFVGQNCKGQ